MSQDDRRWQLHSLYGMIADYQSKYPMLRIGQVWSNFVSWCEGCGYGDLFYMSDEALLEHFKEFTEGSL